MQIINELNGMKSKCVCVLQWSTVSLLLCKGQNVERSGFIQQGFVKVM